MNLLPTRKYGVAPEEGEKKSRTFEEYKLTYDFKRLKKVDKEVGMIGTIEQLMKKFLKT